HSSLTLAPTSACCVPHSGLEPPQRALHASLSSTPRFDWPWIALLVGFIVWMMRSLYGVARSNEDLSSERRIKFHRKRSRDRTSPPGNNLICYDRNGANNDLGPSHGRR